MVQIKSILYVPTLLMGATRYFAGVTYPDIWYSRVQRTIIRMLGESGLSISVKFYPNDRVTNPQIQMVREYYPHIQCVEELLYKVLKEVTYDLILTEAPATTLLECLCAKSQILAFIPPQFIQLHKEAKAQLTQRIFLTETLDDYYATLNQFLQSKTILHPKTDNDFLFSYGIPNTEDEPLQLTKTAIDSVLVRKKRHYEQNFS